MLIVFFYQIRAGQSYQKKSKDSYSNIESQKFCGEVMLFH